MKNSDILIIIKISFALTIFPVLPGIFYFIREPLLIALGLLLGVSFSMLRGISFANTVQKIINLGESEKSTNKSVVNYVINLFVLLLLLTASLMFNIRLGLGVICGVLIIPLVTTIYSFVLGCRFLKKN